jgi:hypothetical protein
MKTTVAEAEQSMRELGYLFMAEQHHISDLFVDRHNAFSQVYYPERRRNLNMQSCLSRTGWGRAIADD